MTSTRPHGPTSNEIDVFQVRACDTQILFVDLQTELTKGSKTNAPDAIAANAAALAAIATTVAVPMTFSLVPVAGDAGRLIPGLARYATDANVIRRTFAPAFLNENLASTLEAHRRPVLVVAGYATEVAVLHAVLGALKAGYRVHVVVDATGSQSSRTERAAIHQMELAGAVPTSIITLAAHFAPDFTQPPGSDILATFDSLRPAP